MKSLHLPFRLLPGFRAPYLRGFWTFERVTWAIVLCLSPPLIATIWNTGSDLFPVIVLSLLTVTVWQAVFTTRRNRPHRRDVLISAMVFALLVGGNFPLWPAALGLSFGIVVGELVFGGRGFSFLNPVVVALAFLIFAFPTATFSIPASWLTYASLPGAAFLMLSRLISWRMFAGFFIGLLGSGYFLVRGPDLNDLLQGSLFFVVIFLACDPAASACTNIGRWANGLLTGCLVWVFSPIDGVGIAAQPLIMAILLGSIFAPLIDRLVVEFNVYTRRRKHG
jgi:Na+-transporting NADH:ubiquinone oxidoreductase subunit B